MPVTPTRWPPRLGKGPSCRLGTCRAQLRWIAPGQARAANERTSPHSYCSAQWTSLGACQRPAFDPPVRNPPVRSRAACRSAAMAANCLVTRRSVVHLPKISQSGETRPVGQTAQPPHLLLHIIRGRRGNYTGGRTQYHSGGVTTARP